LANPPTDLDVWVLAGQSNMQGRALLEGALQPDPRVWSFSSAGRWEIAREPLHRLWESFTPVHQELMRPGMSDAENALSDEEMARRDAAAPNGAGLGIAFGRAMADALGHPVGLIPAAHGGTTLGQWSESKKSLGGRSLYGAMLERIRTAGGRLAGVLWYQGESDGYSVRDGESYGERFDRWIMAVRSDTGVSDLPVIVIQIGRVLEPRDRYGIWPGWGLVREALLRLPDRVAHTAVTTAVDLPLDDTIHVSTSALIRLGGRCARLALALAGRPGYTAGPRVERIERCAVPGAGPARTGLRVHCSGVTGGWSRTDNIPGFELRTASPDNAEPLLVVNARADGAAPPDSILVVLNREPEPGARLGYGLGIDPWCDLVDTADMPLCSFLPRAIER
jgi:sialate O-acetylesterase